MAWWRELERKRGSRTFTAYKVWWRSPDGKTHSKTFHKARERDRFIRQVETRKDEGTYTDPSAGRILFGDFFTHFMATATHLKPSSATYYRGLAQRHILPAFGRQALNTITVADVRAFLAELQHRTGSPTVRAVHRLLRRALSVAQEEGRLGLNPAARAKVPQENNREPRFLTAQEVAAIVDEAPYRYRALLLLLAYGGLRVGEAVGLRVSDLDLLRGRVNVSGALVEIEGKLVAGTTKTGRKRSVALPPFLRDEIGQHLAAFVKPNKPTSLVFPAHLGGAIRPSFLRKKIFYPAARRAGIEPLPRLHDLRHTSVALAISAGAHPKAIQEMLGHSSITVTLDRYGHLFDTLQEQTADALDAIYRRANPTVAEVRELG